MTISIRDGEVEISDDQLEALQHLKIIAMRKQFYAEFVANLYDSAFKCDIASCARYIAGEAAGDNRLATAFNLMLSLGVKGIESHEYLGQDFVESIISDWSLREVHEA